MNEVYNYLQSSDKKHADYALQYEDGIDNLDWHIINYLVEISSKPLSIKERELLSDLTDWIRNIERIGDEMIVFVDIISNLERIGDYASNMAESLVHSVTNLKSRNIGKPLRCFFRYDVYDDDQE